ncbi:MAG: stage VI sporulation protein F [Bacilli bacterium]|nr:stage VI sporulation protein F [bacterium]
MNDNLFKKIEEKTNVDKDTIISLARKLQNGNYKDENTLKEIIHELSSITGREVSEEKERKIINTIINDKVPTDLEKYV